MKKRRIILEVLSILILLATLCSCGNNAKPYSYKMAVDKDNDIYVNKDFFSLNLNREIESNVEQTVNVDIFEEHYSLNYKQTVHSLYYDFYEYESNDGKVYLQVDKDKKTIRRISFDYSYYAKESRFLTENDYYVFLCKYFNMHTEEHIENYNMQCLTRVYVNDLETPSFYSETYNYFYTPNKETEIVASYKFKFFSYFSGYETSDFIEASFLPSSDTVIISFNAHCFDEKSEIVVDQKKVDETIYVALSNSLKDNCVLTTYKQNSFRLVSINGKVYGECTVKFSCKNKNKPTNENEFSELTYIFIELES